AGLQQRDRGDMDQAALDARCPQLLFLAIAQADQGGLVDQPWPLRHDHASRITSGLARSRARRPTRRRSSAVTGCAVRISVSSQRRMYSFLEIPRSPARRSISATVDSGTSRIRISDIIITSRYP